MLLLSYLIAFAVQKVSFGVQEIAFGMRLVVVVVVIDLECFTSSRKKTSFAHVMNDVTGILIGIRFLSVQRVRVRVKERSWLTAKRSEWGISAARVPMKRQTTRRRLRLMSVLLIERDMTSKFEVSTVAVE